MDIGGKLQGAKATLMEAAREAAAAQNARLLAAYGVIAEQIDRDETLLRDIGERVESYEQDLATLARGDEPLHAYTVADRTAAGARKRLLRDLTREGLAVDQASGARMRTETGLEIVAPFATERRPSRWFLSIPETPTYDAIIALCVENNGAVQKFPIPALDIAAFGGHLSRSKGQVKLNVAKDGADWFLVVPARGRVSISRYRNAFEFLRNAKPAVAS